MKYAKEYKTKAKAIDSAKIALYKSNREFVYGRRGGKIKTTQAIIDAVKTVSGGYVPIARRKVSF